MARWTTQQVLALAPDDRSRLAARRLADGRTWSDLGATATLVFGRCQGSGRQPYDVTVDLTEPAFKCTCPSRKFPCKHGLALLLLWAEHGDAVADRVAPADFAGEWAERRAARTAPRAARTDEPADPEARARRRAARVVTMTGGLDELERWLGDLVRQGLAGARRQPYGFWDAMAARLVDAQLPSLADRVRDVGGSLAGRDDWADVLLAEAGRWQLAVEAWRRRDDLPPQTAADLRVLLGWPHGPDEVAAFERVEDRWVVAGVREGTDGRITNQRTWLWGEGTGRWLVLLDFAAAGAALRVAEVVGSVVADTVVVHPGSPPARAAWSGAQRVVGTGGLPVATTVDAAVDQLATWLAANPWRDRLPVSLAAVSVVDDAGHWWLQDADGDRLPLAADVEPWTLLALSGGHPATVFGEWDAGAVHPAAVAPAGEVVPL